MKIIVLLLLSNISFFTNAQIVQKIVNSKVTKYYESGKTKAEGVVVNNKKEGQWIYYHENGRLALKKTFVKGIENGEWLYYNEQGDLTLKVDDISNVDENSNLYLYKNGKVVSIKKVIKENVIVKQTF